MSVSTILTSKRGFVRSSAFLVSALALTAALPMASSAATPVAVWDGDFSDGVLATNGYVLVLNGNTRSQDNSTITIDQAVGVTVESDGTFNGGFTVFFKYSNLNLTLAAKQVLATTTLTDEEARTGVTIDESGQSCGIWQGQSWNNSGTFNSISDSQSAGVLCYTHYSTTSYSGTGTRLFYLNSGVRTTILDAGTLGSDNDKEKYKGFSIGGRKTVADGFSAATGMTISGVAVFQGVLSEADMKAYVWPSAMSGGVATYTNWDYAGTNLLTCASEFNNFENPNYVTFDTHSGTGVTPIYTNSVLPVKWQCFAYSVASAFDSSAYSAPGNVLRFASPNISPVATFAPLTIGGVIVESVATGCSLDASGGSTSRQTLFGDPTAVAETWFRFDTDFINYRKGDAVIIGTANFEVNNGATVTLATDATVQISGASGKAAGGNPLHVAGGVLKMHGNGFITARTLDASDATLDFSDVASRSNDTAPFINCPLVVNADTRFVFPSDISLPYSYKVADSISGTAPSFCLYANGNPILADLSIDAEHGVVSLSPIKVWTRGDNASFDDEANWSDSSLPSQGANVIVKLVGDTEISLSKDYELGTLTIFGPGAVSFTGGGVVTSSVVAVKNGAILLRSGVELSTGTISVDSGCVVRIVAGEAEHTERATISGAGAVETYGKVVLAAANTMTGGITVKPGSALSAGVSGGYGEYQTSWAYTEQRQVVVEDGGTVDINNSANTTAAVALTVAGKGVLVNGVYSGAVTYSGQQAITSNGRQISSLVLTGDTLVDLGAGWGLVHNGWNPARLGLNGHTLIVRGTSTFPVVNANTASGATTTGTLVLDGATLELSRKASNLTGINVVARGCASINIATAPTALGSLTFKPSATGTTATAWNLPAGLVPTVRTDNIDPEGLAVGDTLTLLTVPAQTELTSETVSVVAGGRYTTTISGNTVTATINALTNFMHYDFNAANSQATDSTYSCGNMNPSFVASKNGQAGVFDSGFKPHYGSNTSGKSPFYAGEMTVTSLLKVKEANNTILWGLGNGLAGNSGIALIAKNSSTVTLVKWTNGAANGSDVVSVAGITDLMNRWHLVTIVADANGTTLYVDDTFATVDTVLPSGISGQGQFGSIHSGKGIYNWVDNDGFLLDDWRVYDTALTAKEVKALKSALLPDPLFIRLR